MTEINELIVNKETSTVEWKWRGSLISKNLTKIDQAMINKNDGVIYILFETENLPKSLALFSGDGTELARLSSPESFEFYYLTEYPEVGVSVVCVSRAPVDGRSDWHFVYNKDSHGLERHCPSY